MPLPHQEALAQLSRLRAWLSQVPAGVDASTGQAAALARVEAALHANQQLWEALNRAVAHYLTDTPPRQFLSELLDALLLLTRSQYGFIGEVFRDPDGQPYLKTHAITDIAWDAASRALYETSFATGMEFRNLRTLFGEVLATGQRLIVNDAATDPRRGGLPPGHPPLKAFLGLPCLLENDLIGMVGLANRPDGYDEGLAAFLQPVLDTCAVMIAAFRQHQQRREAQEALHRSEARYRALEAHSFEVVILLDGQGNLLYTGPHFEDVAGYRPEELQGRSVFSAVHADDLAEATSAFAFVLQQPGLPVTRCVRAPQKDGSIRWIEATGCNWLHQPELQAIVVNCRNVTDRKESEEALQRSEQLFRAVTQQMPDGLFLLDLHDPVCPGKIIEVNEAACRMHQSDRAELLGRSIFDLADPTTVTQRTERLQRLQHGETLCFEAGLRRKDGSTLPVEVVAHPISYGNRHLVLALDRDISERKKAEEMRRKLEAQIQHTQKLESLGVLAGGIAHDFNNLLTSILGNVSLAMMELTPGSPAAYTLQQIETAACRAADLTRQMLAYSGKGRFLIQPVDLSRVVEEIANLLQTVISKKAVLRFDFMPNLPAIKADVTQIRQVVMNLITNASDAIGEKSGTIALRTGVMLADRAYLAATYVQDELPEGYFVYVDVADTGCGMDAPTQRKIFDPFFTTKHTGRGLGLAAVLGIMRGHRGAIKVYSELGRGTTFRLLFPCGDQAALDGVPQRTVAETFRGSGTVLVADDEETVRALARRVLERAGFHVLLAADGREAVELYRRHGPDIRVVLLDWTMPHLSGEEAFREMRVLNPRVRIILMSGYNEQEVVTQFTGKRLNGFLQKPFRVVDLLALVQQTLEDSSPVRK